MKKKSKIVITLFLILFLSVGITYAYASSQQNTATNVVTVGKVSIELINEDEVAEGNVISAGKDVKKKVQVKNIGTYPAYVRIKIKKEWTSASEGFDVSKLSTKAIVANCKSDWVEGEGEDSSYIYYYYQNILPANATVDFMDSYYVSGEKMEVLADYHESSISLSGKISVQAEAVQSDYFDEGLIKTDGKITGWDDITFDGFVEDTTTPVPVTTAAVSGTAVEFIGNAGNFVSFEQGNSDLFLMTKGMLPGQEAKQEVNITNTSSDKMEVFLSAKLPDGLTDEELEAYKELLENLELHIESEKNGTLFGGTLLGHATDGKQISLGVFSVGAGDKLTISVKLSPKWKKASCQTKVLWIFSTKKMATTPSNPNNPSNPGVVTTPEPTPIVTETPTIEPTVSATATPEITEKPIVTKAPTPEPFVAETPTPKPEITEKPTKEPLVVPGYTEEPKPTDTPTPTPYVEVTPTVKPTPKLTATPGFGPLDSPEIVPTNEPTATPKASKVTHDKVEPKPNIPTQKATKTGDSTPVIFWIVMAAGSLAGCVVSGRKLWMMRE